MSYLDLPRIHLLGTFFTDPSTVNNDPSHYNPGVEQPSPWQTPMGLHRFMFVDVKVNAAVDARGDFVEQDMLLGAMTLSTDTPSAAKIVDLDVYQQGVPTIYGFGLKISASSDVHLVGALDPCAANGLWFTRVLPTRGWQTWDSYGESSFGGDTYSCALFQSVLRVAPSNWPASADGVLAQLRTATTMDENGNILLSMRFVLDSYQNVSWHDDYCHGRVLATLGPVSAPSEPESVLGGRWLLPRPLNTARDKWFWPDLYAVQAKFIQRSPSARRLVLDLADSVSLQTPGGPPVPIGELNVFLGDGTTGPIGPFQFTEDVYQNLGGIVELPVTDQQWARQDQPLIINTTRTDIGGAVLWAEKGDVAIDALDRVFRLAGVKGSTATARALVTARGRPATGFRPGVEVVSVVEGIKGQSVPPDAHYPGNTPQAEGALIATVSNVDAQGYCTVTLTVTRDPGARTAQLDGQLYFVVVYDATQSPPDLRKVAPRQETLISCVVDSAYSAKPSWDTVRAIMEPYAKLYPGMTDQIDLTQEQAFFTFSINPPWIVYDGPNFKPYILPDGRKIAAGAIPYYMTRDLDDTRFMPVTRDLSQQKLLTVLNYVADIQTDIKPTPPPPGNGH
jgi:hypothetical protein